MLHAAGFLAALLLLPMAGPADSAPAPRSPDGIAARRLVAMTETTQSQHSARAGEAIELALKSNPSTGYRWEIDSDASAGLELIGVEELPVSAPVRRGGEPVVGAPVEQRWRISARAKGAVRLVLVYRRSWESLPPAKRHTATIDIAG